MASEISKKVVALQERIFKEGYWPEYWCDCLVKMNMSVSTIDQHERPDRDLVLLCHYFWESLPDHPRIRNDIFFQLCNLAEQVGDFDHGQLPE